MGKITKKLIIIGNGFDLFHGINSKYSDLKRHIYNSNKTNLIKLIRKCTNNENLLNDVEIAIKALKQEEENLSKYITNVPPRLNNTSILKNALYINFNYTNILEQVYNIPREKILYIQTDYKWDNKESFFYKLKQVKEVIVLGHPIPDIDLKYFRKIKNSVSENCKWMVSYYKKNEITQYNRQLSRLGVKKSDMYFIDLQRIM